MESFFVTVASLGTEIVVFMASVVIVATGFMLNYYLKNKKKLKARKDLVLNKYMYSKDALMIFENGKLLWANSVAKEYCPFVGRESELDQVVWKFNGTLDRVVDLEFSEYEIFNLNCMEVTISNDEKYTESDVDPTFTPHFKVKNYKLIGENMEAFQSILDSNQHLMEAAALTVFATNQGGELECYPQFDMLGESFFKLGYYLVKDFSNPHMDFLFQTKGRNCYIQLTLKNFSSANLQFGEDFFLSGLGTESLEYQLTRLETIFQSLGGSLQLLNVGRDFVLLGKVKTLAPIASITESRQNL